MRGTGFACSGEVCVLRGACFSYLLLDSGFVSLTSFGRARVCVCVCVCNSCMTESLSMRRNIFSLNLKLDEELLFSIYLFIASSAALFSTM